MPPNPPQPDGPDPDKVARRISRNFIYMSAGVFGSALLQYILYFWVARYLGTERYGTFSLALAVAILSAPLCDIGMSLSLIRTCSQRPQSMPEVFGASLLWRFIFVAPLGCLAALFCVLAGYSTDVLRLFVPLYLAAFLDGIGILCSAAFQAWERMSYSSAILLGRNLLRTSAFLVAVVTGGGLMDLVVYYAIASALSALPALMVVWRRTAIRFVRHVMARVLRDALPFGLAMVATMIHAQVGVTILGYFRSETEVGIYHAPMRFIVIAQIIPYMVGIVAAPLSYRTGLIGTEASSRIYRAKATGLCALGTLGSLLLVLQGDLLVRLCLGPKYQASEILAMVVGPVVFIRFLSSPLGDALASIGRQKYLSMGWWVALTVNIGANLVLVPARGGFGAALALLLSESSLLIFFAASAVASGLELRWSSVLWHPLATVMAVACVFFVGRAVAPASVNWCLFPAGVAVYALLVWIRPTEEQRILLRGWREENP